MDLKEIRIRKGLTQQEAADVLEISRRKYQSLEKEGNSSSSMYLFYCDKLNNHGKTPLFYTNIVLWEDLKMLYEGVRHYKNEIALNTSRISFPVII